MAIEQPMTAQKMLLNLGQGDWNTGFPSVTAQLWGDDRWPVQSIGSLPPAPHLEAQYQHWQQLYEALYGTTAIWRRQGRAANDFEFDTTELTHVSRHEFETLGAALETDFNLWLTAASFAPIERHVRTQLPPQTAVQIMLTASAKPVLRFPWRLWQLFEDYPNAELSVSLPAYSRSLKQASHKATSAVRILAVLGSDEGIDIETDRTILSQLPSAQVVLLAQPSLDELQQQLWQGSWDVLFFAGHSTSQGQGYLQVNAAESLTIEQLKYALQRAIKQGLQLAILNSCDGLGLAWNLADLHLPQAIVMREPVSDAIAQQFLKNFLAAFSSGQSLYLSVREAREKLHGRPGTYAAWLPVIVQNPSEAPLTWKELIAGPTEETSKTVPLGVATEIPPVAPAGRPQSDLTSVSAIPEQAGRGIALKSLAVAAAILGIRWLGLLQGIELSTYDALMRLRPVESPDSRMVVITVDENDIQAQTSPERRGSLSDQTLQQTLSTLARYEPRVIALDLYRDFPATTTELVEMLARPNVLGICKSRDPLADKIGISPSPEFGPYQLGFSDFIEETDGILRRQLLTLTPDPVSPCTTPYGFATLTAIHYLRGEGLLPTFTPEGDLSLGETVFPRLSGRTGGLQDMDSRGNQLLLNFRALPSPDRIAAKIPLQALLTGQVNPESLRDRIVFIGVTAPSGDFWATPYGVQGQNKTAGVFIQAQMTSQLISAVLDGRPLIWVLPQWGEAFCILAGAIAGGRLGWRCRSSRLWLFGLLCASGLIVGAWATLLVGGWLPLMPTLAAFGGSLAVSQHRVSKP